MWSRVKLSTTYCDQIAMVPLAKHYNLKKPGYCCHLDIRFWGPKVITLSGFRCTCFTQSCCVLFNPIIRLWVLVLPTIKSFSFFFFFRGKGYYDTYLAKARTVGLDPKAIGLSFKQQIVDDIPTTTNDVLIDRVLTSDWDVIMLYHNKEKDVLIDRVLT